MVIWAKEKYQVHIRPRRVNGCFVEKMALNSRMFVTSILECSPLHVLAGWLIDWLVGAYLISPRQAQPFSAGSSATFATLVPPLPSVTSNPHRGDGLCSPLRASLLIVQPLLSSQPLAVTQYASSHPPTRWTVRPQGSSWHGQRQDNRLWWRWQAAPVRFHADPFSHQHSHTHTHNAATHILVVEIVTPWCWLEMQKDLARQC